MYRKLNPRTISHQSERLLEVVAQHIRGIVESPPFILNLSKLRSIPPEAQVVYWIWIFLCEAGGSGLEGFLLNQNTSAIRGVYESLLRIGASGIAELMRSGIPLAIEIDAPIADDASESWVKSAKRDDRFKTLRSLDVDDRIHRYRRIHEMAEKFIREHWAQFVERA